MSRIFHLLNMSLIYGRSKGVWAYRHEEPPLGNLAAAGDLEESASHHIPGLPATSFSKKYAYHGAAQNLSSGWAPRS